MGRASIRKKKCEVIEDVRFSFSRPQYEFLTAAEKYVAAVAGFGSGKTHAGLSRIIQNMLQAAPFGGIDQAYLAPTYPLIRDIFYPAVDKMLPEIGLAYVINESKHIITIIGLGKIYCRTMEKPEKIVGWEVADAVLDEFDILPVDKALQVFRKTSARLRQKNPTGRINQLFVTTTPEGFKATYRLFKQKPLKNSRLIQMSTHSNRKNLPDDYIEELMEQYPPALIDAYLHGRFVNLTSGSVYPSYDRIKHRSKEVVLPGEPLFIGQDFNVEHMASTVYVKRSGDAGIEWHVVGEIVDGFDTPATIEAISERYEGHKITMYPDATGKKRQTSGASKSDIALLKLAGYKVKAKDSNPLVKDRVLAVNRAFDKGFLFVNDTLAPTVADNLEQQVYDKTGQPDKKSGNDHQNDGTGYPIVFEMPVRKPIVVTSGIRTAS